MTDSVKNSEKQCQEVLSHLCAGNRSQSQRWLNSATDSLEVSFSEKPLPTPRSDLFALACIPLAPRAWLQQALVLSMEIIDFLVCLSHSTTSSMKSGTRFYSASSLVLKKCFL